MLNSIWNQEINVPAFPKLTHDLKTDVLVIGGGLAGILCAYRLKQAGINYALIEAGRICSGVTADSTAKITSQHGLIYHQLIRKYDDGIARMYWEANEAALNEYKILAESVSCDFELKSNYIYSRNSLDKLERELKALEELRIPSEFIRANPLPFPTAGAVCFRNQAQFHPRKFVSQIVNGLNIYEHTAAREFTVDSVLTDLGKITANKIIMATHFPIINKHGGYFLKMYQHRSYVLALKDADNVHGMYLDEAENGMSFRNYDNMLLIGGGGHRTGKQGGGWSELEQFADFHYADSREVCRWATQDCMSLDGIPYIGQYSCGTPNLYVATGFNKWGITSSMVASMILTDLVQEKENPYAAVFSPSRSILHTQLLSNALETTLNLLRISKPRCPHLGCALRWNSAEHSWDCPCHGSRFSGSGKLLNNPATGDLRRKNSKGYHGKDNR